jgi:hypothetical protein
MGGRLEGCVADDEIGRDRVLAISCTPHGIDQIERWAVLTTQSCWRRGGTRALPVTIPVILPYSPTRERLLDLADRRWAT